MFEFKGQFGLESKFQDREATHRKPVSKNKQANKSNIIHVENLRQSKYYFGWERWILNYCIMKCSTTSYILQVYMSIDNK